MTESNNNRLLKAEEVAQMLGIPKARVYQLSRNGEFQGILVELGERQFRYRPDALKAYIEQGGRQNQSAQAAVQ